MKKVVQSIRGKCQAHHSAVFAHPLDAPLAKYRLAAAAAIQMHSAMPFAAQRIHYVIQLKIR